jgi:haloacetate dehalogenase
MEHRLNIRNKTASARDVSRRELLKQAAAATAVASLGGCAAHAQREAQPHPPQPEQTAPQPTQQDAPATRATPMADPTPFFPDFTTAKVDTSGATIHLVKGGEGPPLLLLHGAPYSHVSWRLIAPQLAKNYTVIATDLRGYGDSSKSADTADHANYSKRNMALDQVEVMQHFGFDRFAVVGHDRGARVAHRMALDHADKLTKLAVIDVVPTHYSYTHVTLEFVQAYFHWFNNIRAAPAPETDLMMQNQMQLARATTDVQKEYLRTSATAENIHAMCEDYRAAASIDLKHDEADRDRKISAPLLALWANSGSIGKIFDVLQVWKEYAQTVTGKGLNGGHSLQEDAPEDVLAQLTAFLQS